MRRIAKIVVLGVVLSTGVASAQSQGSIQGAWRLAEISTTGANGSTNRAPQPSLYLFTAKHFSITRVTSDTARPPLKDPAKVTEAEALAIFGPFQAIAGTYEVAAGSLSTILTVAKQPQAMAPGSKPFVYSMTLQGNTLTLVQKSGTQGPTTNPVTFKLTRVE